MVDVRGDVLRPPHGTTPAAVKSNKNQKWDPLRVGGSRHPWRTPTVVLNQSLWPSLNWALSYRFSTTRMVLASMLYFLVVAFKGSCHTLSKAFMKFMKTWKKLCWCCRYFRRGSGDCIFALWWSFLFWNQLTLLQWFQLVAGFSLRLS